MNEIYEKYKAEIKLAIPILFFVIMGIFLVKACLRNTTISEPTIQQQEATLKQKIKDNDKKIDSIRRNNYRDNLLRSGIRSGE